jgi:hypothetical protein
MSIILPLNTEVEIPNVSSTEVWLYRVALNKNVDASDYSVIVTIKKNGSITQVYPCHLLQNMYTPEQWIGFFDPSPYKLWVNYDEQIFCKLVITDISTIEILESGELFYEVFEPVIWQD